MILPSGLSTTNYSISAASKGWGAGWPNCSAINGGAMVKVKMTRSGAEFAGGVHRNIAELVGLICNEIERRGYRFVPGWCWGASCRAIAGTSRASNHSWGLAIDMNAPNNPYTSSGVHDIPDWAFSLFRSYGFGLGADYSGKQDWMHAEFQGNVSDAAAMTALARRNIGSGGGGVVTPPDNPIVDEDAWLTVGAKEDITNKIQGLQDLLFERKYQVAGHDIRSEVQWAANQQIIPAFRDRVEFIFYQDEGGIWEANIDAGTSWRLPSSAALANRQMVLTQAGRKWVDWAGGDVAEPSAFGRRNTADVAPDGGTATPPPPTGGTYTVKSGDTLSGIAKSTGFSVEELQRWNRIANPDDIAVDQVLRLYP